VELIQDQNITSGTIFVDDKYLLNCMYTDCTLVYCGGDVAWSNTVFINCRCEFQGSALRTTEFLQMIGLLHGQPELASPVHASKALQ